MDPEDKDRELREISAEIQIAYTSKDIARMEWLTLQLLKIVTAPKDEENE